jgi:hypothetical protein
MPQLHAACSREQRAFDGIVADSDNALHVITGLQGVKCSMKGGGGIQNERTAHSK